jgi:hypothetical protein
MVHFDRLAETANDLRSRREVLFGLIAAFASVAVTAEMQQPSPRKEPKSPSYEPRPFNAAFSSDFGAGGLTVRSV